MSDQPAPKLYFDYWTQFHDFMVARNSPVKMGKPSTSHWTVLGLGRSSVNLVVFNNSKDQRSGFYLSISLPNSRAYLQAMRDLHNAEIMATFPEADWQEDATSKESRIFVKRPSNLTNKQTWPGLNAWLAERIEKSKAMFPPMIKDLPIGDGMSSAYDAADLSDAAPGILNDGQ